MNILSRFQLPSSFDLGLTVFRIYLNYTGSIKKPQGMYNLAIQSQDQLILRFLKKKGGQYFQLVGDKIGASLFTWGNIYSLSKLQICFHLLWVHWLRFIACILMQMDVGIDAAVNRYLVWCIIAPYRISLVKSLYGNYIILPIIRLMFT